MSTSISLFDYHLPPELIAQTSVEPRDNSRLLVLTLCLSPREVGEFTFEHRKFFEIIEYLKHGDVMVMNDTKVFKARLRGKVRGKEIEVFLLPPQILLPSPLGRGVGGEGIDERWVGGEVWLALLKPGRKVKVGDTISFGEIQAKVLEKFSDGTASLLFSRSREEVLSFADKHGEIPVPPYVKKVPEKIETYQTVYARETGSVAAPTAGFHFTPELLQKIKEKGINIQFITLHVGLGTFRPIKGETLEEHEMHSEFVEIKSEAARRINAAKTKGRRIVAVGTTTTRALEGVAKLNGGRLPDSGFIGEVNLFITPGFKFKVIDALITNFHLPKSTLLVLVSAFVGRENILAAYEEAIRLGYRFYSFGDAMFIERDCETIIVRQKRQRPPSPKVLRRARKRQRQ